MAFVIRGDGSRAEVHHNTKGAINEHIASAWLMKEGYDVFRNISPRGRADLVARKWDEPHFLIVDVKSEGSDLDGFSPMNEGQRETAHIYEQSNVRYLVVKDNGNCFWWDELSKSMEEHQEETHWVDPHTGQRFLHPRNEMSKSEWSYFSFWMLKHHKDKLTQSQIDFLHRVANISAGRKSGTLTKRDKEWLRKVHRFIYRKIIGLDPDTGISLAANDNQRIQEADAA